MADLGTPLDFALRYAAHGMPVLPLHSVRDGRCSCGKPGCASVGKHPRTEHGAHDASTDAETIRAWWKQWPDANVGLALDGLVVIDIDPRNGGNLQAIPQQLPETCHARTGGGGSHHIFRAQNGTKYAGRLGQGIDLKSGDGSYIVVAPSVHASGAAYEWDAAPWEQEPAPAPDWLPVKSDSAAAQTELTLDLATVDQVALSVRLAAVQADSDLRQLLDGRPPLWGTDTSGSGLDFALALVLKRLHFSPAEIFVCMANYPYGKKDGRTAEYLNRTIAKVCAPPAAPAASVPEADDFAPYLSEFWDDSLEIDWLIRDFLEDNVTAEIWGPAGSYKTFLALDIAVSVGGGIDWHGNEVERSGPVLYVCGEGRTGINRRIKALCQKRGLGRDVPIRVSKMPLLLSKSEQAKFLQEKIARFDRPPVLIIVDTLARNFGGNENSAEDMGAFLDNVETIRRLCNATVLIIHHCGHDGSHARGSYALHAGVDAEYQAKPDKARKELVLQNSKMKNAADGGSIFLQAEVTSLMNADGSVALDKKGQPITTIVMQTGSSRQADAVAAFFMAHPGLEGAGRSKYKERLPIVLQKLYDTPGATKIDLCKACGVKAGAALDVLLQQMRCEGLLDMTAMRLTVEGKRAAETFGKRADMRFADQITEKAEREALAQGFQGA
ncbi:AAA family ATPase [Pseudomonas sp. R-28-1W-6]|uniref:bifunctional DNA primase/polymerase n=1 Tax=Pseudomonas sp. R-28-1W-6 TaxID=2650101 RepID=UPI00136665D0|nr:bifunctional DNA primase/polymerase [Pseudomonas sp. R-28-1W-6]MWV11161.1 AAA family ATPase [Pseudomonas sp. R-28-1W-6]